MNGFAGGVRKGSGGLGRSSPSYWNPSFRLATCFPVTCSFWPLILLSGLYRMLERMGWAGTEDLCPPRVDGGAWRIEKGSQIERYLERSGRGWLLSS